MGLPEFTETFVEQEITCDICEKLLGFTKWMTDLSTPCPICDELEPTWKDGGRTCKMLCINCRNLET